MTRKSILYIGFGLLLTVSCSHNPLDVNPDGISIGINYIHLDSIFVNTPANGLEKAIEKSGIRSDQILAYELGQCLGVGPLADSGTTNRIKLFVNDPFVRRVEKRIHEKFTNLSERKAKINSGFQYLKYHFPNGKVPQNIVFLNSHFASNAFCTENEIGISLERYLGTKTDVIQELPDPIYQWVKDGMDAQYLERDALTAWIMTHYVPEVNGNTAEQMIRWGKIIFLTEAAFPDAEKNLILRYSPSDYQWALDNEFAFWQYLVNEKLLFSENERDHANFLNEGPFTIGLPEKGPDRLGQFLGWRMVWSYMKENPSTKLTDLIQLPYNEILQAYEIEQ